MYGSIGRWFASQDMFSGKKCHRDTTVVIVVADPLTQLGASKGCLLRTRAAI